jgi:hypothetical protein
MWYNYHSAIFVRLLNYGDSMKETDIAWAAGLIDGEGCVHIHKMTRTKNTYYGLMISVTNTNLDAIIKIKNIFEVGSIFESKTYKDKPIYTLTVRGKEAAMVICEILPYSIIKREELMLGLFFQNTIIYGGRVPITYLKDREDIYNEMRSLK